MTEKTEAAGAAICFCLVWENSCKGVSIKNKKPKTRVMAFVFHWLMITRAG